MIGDGRLLSDSPVLQSEAAADWLAAGRADRLKPSGRLHRKLNQNVFLCVLSPTEQHRSRKTIYSAEKPDLKSPKTRFLTKVSDDITGGTQLLNSFLLTKLPAGVSSLEP